MTPVSVRIEPVDACHADAVQRLAPDARIAATTKVPHPYPADGARAWIASAAAGREQGTMYAFAIVDDRGDFVGPCSLMSVDRAAAVAELGYWIGVPHQGRGLATAGARQVLAFGFETLGLERIVADCLDHNAASRRVLAKLGFVRVGAAAGDGRGELSAYELTRDGWQRGRGMSTLRLVTVPGYTGSGPGHWQSLWEREDPSIVRVEQDDWDRPQAESWAASIDRVVRAAAGPVVLVAHSCGTVAVAHWATRFEPAIAGAFLVAPPDSAREDLDEPIRAFALPEFRRLPFPACVVASEDDPYCAFDRARAMARAWGASFVSAGRAGHLHTAAGYGPWPEGRRLLAEFCTALERDHPRG